MCVQNFQQEPCWIAGTMEATMGKLMCKVKIEGKDASPRKSVESQINFNAIYNEF